MEKGNNNKVKKRGFESVIVWKMGVEHLSP